MFEVSAITLSSRMPAVVIPPQAILNPAAIHVTSMDVTAVKPLNPIVSIDHSEHDREQFNKGHSLEKIRHVDLFI